MRKPTKSSLKRKLDKLVSEIVRKRGKCERTGYGCMDGNKATLQTAHIFSRKYLNTRWDLENVLCLCASCHFWSHANPILFGEFVKKILGEDKYELLKESHNLIFRPTLDTLITKVQVLEELRKDTLNG